VISGVLLVGLVLVLVLGERAPDPVGRGTRAPGFELPDASDGRIRSLDEFRGKVVLLNFWATWCKPCEDEMPSMERLHRRLEGTDFSLLAISVDTDTLAAKYFRDRLELTFPILLDPESRVARTYQTTGYPESFLLDRNGVIVSQRFVGPREWDDPAYVDLVQRLLAGPPE
jgi:peroxiredoxin